MTHQDDMCSPEAGGNSAESAGDSAEAHDDRRRRCPRLGHQVPFRYCRTQEGATVCRRVLNCWWQQFDVAAFLRCHLSPEEFSGLSGNNSSGPQHRGKLASILELVEAAKRRGD